MISSRTSSSWVTSCRLAPVTTIDNGTPRPSVNKCRLVPFFPPVCRVATNCLTGQGGFYQSPINTLPAPGDAFHFIVFGKARTPKSNKKSHSHPSHKMRMYRTGTAKSFLRQGLPLAARAQNIQNGFENPPGWYRLSAASRLALICLIRVTFNRRYQRLNFLPERIGNVP